MELDEVGSEAVGKLEALKHDFEESEPIYSELDHRIQEATTRLHGDWGKVAASAKALADEIQHRKTELEHERTSVHETHDHLAKEIETAHHDSHDATEHVTKEWGASREYVTTLEGQHKQHLEDASAKGQHLKDQAHTIEQDLNTLIQDVGHFVGTEIGNLFQTIGHEVEEHGHQWQTFITDHVLSQVNDKTHETGSKLEEFHSKFQEHGNNLAETATTHTTQAMQKCTQDHQETLHTLHDAGQDLKGTLGQLGGFIEKGTQIINDGKDAIHTGVDTTSTGVNLAIGVFKDLKDMLSHFSFI